MWYKVYQVNLEHLEKLHVLIKKRVYITHVGKTIASVFQLWQMLCPRRPRALDMPPIQSIQGIARARSSLSTQLHAAPRSSIRHPNAN